MENLITHLKGTRQYLVNLNTIINNGPAKFNASEPVMMHLNNLFGRLNEDFRLSKQIEAENVALKEKYKDEERLWEIAVIDKCNGECNANAPYERCPECAAGTLLNELGEIRNAGLRDIEKTLED